MAVKQLGAPSSKEVSQLEAYVHQTLWTPEGGERRAFIQGRDHSVRVLGLDPTLAGIHVHATRPLVFPTACQLSDRRIETRPTDRGMQVRASLVYWSDELQADPAGARASAPALAETCLRCWTSCPKKRDCCNWMVCWSESAHAARTSLRPAAQPQSQPAFVGAALS